MARSATSRLKREFLELLEKDLEFRYAVAGFLGFSEILKRLEEHDKKFQEILAEIKALRENQDKLWEGQNKLWEEVRRLWEEVRALREDQKRLWESQNKLWEEVKALREDQGRLWEGQNKLWEEVRKLRESQDKLWEEVRKLWEEVRALREDQNKLWEEVKALREDQKRLWEEVRTLRLGYEELRSLYGQLRDDLREVKVAVERVSHTLERVTLTLEEEARSIIAHRLRQELGVEVELTRAFVDAREIDVYGAVEDLCVVGEVTVRLGPRLVEELLEKLELIKQRRPDLLRRRVIKVVYTYVAIPQAIDLAVQHNVWVLKWDRDLAPLKIEELTPG